MTEDSSSQDIRIGRIISDYLDRQAGGENLSDELLVAEHPDLAEEIRRELKTAENLLRARAGDSAEPGPGPMTLPGDSFPGYEILGEAQQGGQGVVFKALQKSTKRKVAIKVIREGPFAGSPGMPRFDREIEVLGALKHPRIVTIHESGIASGCRYFVMDYISGQPLDLWMAGAARSIEQILRLFGQICEAVNSAHLKGIIHRDLKPRNIRIDNEGEPHILDFGLAKVTSTGLIDSSQQAMTVTGQFVGSLPWASPEQAAGDPDGIDTRTDVYALGVILYQMLTGRFPYDVVGPMRTVLDRIATAEPVRPSTLRRGIGDEIETIVLKCLRKEPERRYQTAGEAGRDVERYLKGEPIEAKQDSSLYVLRKMLRRHRVGFAVAVVFAVIVGVSLVVSTSLWRRAVAERDRAVAAEHQQAQQRVRADQAATQAEQARSVAEQGRVQVQQQAEKLAQTVYISRISMAQNANAANEFYQASVFLQDCPTQRRSWEWHYLQRISTQVPLRVIPSGTAKAAAACFTRDCRQVAVAGEGIAIQVLDAVTGKVEASLAGHAYTVRLLLWSPDGTKLVSADDRGAVRLWDLRTRSHNVLLASGAASGPNNAAFSPDGSRLALIDLKSGLVLVDTASGKVVADLNSAFHGRTAVAYSPDGKRIACAEFEASKGSRVEVLDAASGKQLLAFFVHSGDVSCLTWSPDGRRIASGGQLASRGFDTERTLGVFDSQTGERLVSTRGHDGTVNDIRFSPDGKLLVSGGSSRTPTDESPDKTLIVWDANTGRQLYTLSAHGGHVGDAARSGAIAVAWSPDGGRLFSFGAEGILKSWSTQDQIGTRVLEAHPNSVMKVAFSPDGQRLLSCSTKRGEGAQASLRVWDVKRGIPLVGLDSAAGCFVALWTPDGKQIVTAGMDKTVRFWDSTTGKQLGSALGGWDSLLADLSISPDGQLLACACGPVVKVLRIADRTEWFHYKGGGKNWTAAFSPDGRWVAFGGDTGALSIWDCQSRTEFRVLPVHATIRSACFSPDSQLVAFAHRGSPYSIELWNVGSGIQVTTLFGCKKPIQSIGFSPDGRRLASCGSDNLLRLWDPRAGTQVFMTRAHDATVLSVGFGPDGTKMATGGQDGLVKIWDATPVLGADSQPRLAESGPSRPGSGPAPKTK